MAASPPFPPPSHAFEGLGEFFRVSIGVLGRHFVVIVAVFTPMAILYLLANQWMYLLVPEIEGTVPIIELPVVWFAGFAIFLLANLVMTEVQLVLLASILAAKLGGREVNIGEAVRWGLRRLPSVIWYSLIALLLVCVGIVSLVVPGLYLMLRLFPIVYVAWFEPDQAPLTRSWQLTQDRALEIFLVIIGLLLLLLIPSGLISLALGPLSGIPLVFWIGQAANLFLQWAVPSVFWLMLYGWLRAETPIQGTGLSMT